MSSTIFNFLQDTHCWYYFEVKSNFVMYLFRCTIIFPLLDGELNVYDDFLFFDSRR